MLGDVLRQSIDNRLRYRPVVDECNMMMDGQLARLPHGTCGRSLRRRRGCASTNGATAHTSCRMYCNSWSLKRKFGRFCTPLTPLCLTVNGMYLMNASTAAHVNRTRCTSKVRQGMCLYVCGNTPSMNPKYSSASEGRSFARATDDHTVTSFFPLGCVC